MLIRLIPTPDGDYRRGAFQMRQRTGTKGQIRRRNVYNLAVDHPDTRPRNPNPRWSVVHDHLGGPAGRRAATVSVTQAGRCQSRREGAMAWAIRKGAAGNSEAGAHAEVPMTAMLWMPAHLVRIRSDRCTCSVILNTHPPASAVSHLKLRMKFNAPTDLATYP